jgi:hypothetical protein
MSKIKQLLIPAKLQELKAYQIHQQRLKQGKFSDPETNWNEAREYFAHHPHEILIWSLKNSLLRIGRSFKNLLYICGRILVFPRYLYLRLFELFKSEISRPFALEIIKIAISLIALICTAIGLSYNCKVLETATENVFLNSYSEVVKQINSTDEYLVVIGINTSRNLAIQFPNHRLQIIKFLGSFINWNSSSQILNSSKNQIKLRNIIVWNHKANTFFPDANSSLKPQDKYYINLVELAAKVIGELNKDQTYKKEISFSMANSKLTNMQLSGLNYSGGDLSYSDLTGSPLHGTNINGTIMIGTIFTNSQIKQSCNWKDARFAVSDKENAQRVDQLIQDKASDPEKTIDCSKWKHLVPNFGYLHKPSKRTNFLPKTFVATQNSAVPPSKPTLR